MFIMLGLVMMLMAMTTRASSNYIYLKQSLGTAMYQAARDVAYDQSMDFSALLKEYDTNAESRQKANDLYKRNFQTRLVGLLPDAAKDLKVDYYQVDASKGLLDAEASYHIIINGRDRVVKDHETIIITKKRGVGWNDFTIKIDPNGGNFNKNGVISNSICSFTFQHDNPVHSFDISDTFGKVYRDGWRFTGWYDAPKLGHKLETGPDEDFVTNVDHSMTYYAHWTQSEFTIDYKLKGGHFTDEDLKAGRVKEGYSHTDPTFTLPQPEKLGADFLGWTKNATDSNQSTTTTPQKVVDIPSGTTGDLSYTANWKNTIYHIEYDDAGSKIDENSPVQTYTKEYTVDDEVDLPIMKKEGMTFIGWAEAGTGDFYGTAIPAGSIGDHTGSNRLVAQFTLINYSIKYNLGNGGTTDNPTEYNVETPTFTLKNPKRRGYVFLGWTGTGISGDAPVKTVTINQGSSGSREFTAHWQARDVKIVYNMNNGREYDTDEEGNKIIPTKEPHNRSQIPTKSEQFDYEFKIDDLPDVEYYNDKTKEFEDIEFQGWEVSGGDIPEKEHTIIHPGDHLDFDVDQITLTAKWGKTYFHQRIVLQLQDSHGNYEPSEGDNSYEKVLLDKNVRYDSQITVDSAYNVKIAGKEPETITTNALAGVDMTPYIGGGFYVAQLLRYKTPSNIASDAGDDPDGTQEKGDFDTPLAGYDISKFASDDPAETPYVTSTGYRVNKGTTLVLRIRRKRFNVTYNGMADTFFPKTLTGIAYYGGPPEIKWNITRPQTGDDDQDIEGSKDKTEVKQAIPNIDSDTQYAEWYNRKTFDVPSDQAEYDTNGRLGYTFDGWYSGDTKADDVTLTSDMTFTQRWSPIVYTISYDFDGDDDDENTTANDSNKIVDPNNPTTYTIETPTFTLKQPTRTGYDFTGWYRYDADREGNDGDNDAEMNAQITRGSRGNLKFTASWDPHTYTIQFIANKGKISGTMPAMAKTYDEPAVLPANQFTRQGYDFTGWNTKEDGTGTSYPDQFEIEKGSDWTTDKNVTLTLYAQWKQHFTNTSFTSPGRIVEDNWNPDSAKELQPNTTVSKDPYLKSDISTDAYGYIRVEIPVIRYRSNKTTVVTGDAVTLNNLNVGTGNDQFTLINSKVSTTEGQNSVYLYAYNGTIPSQGRTSKLFTSFTVKNYHSLLTDKISTSVNVTGIVTSKLAEDYEDMSTPVKAADARGIRNMMS